MTRPLQAAALLSAAILLSRIIGLVQQSVISAAMTPIDTDAYTTAFRITDFVNYLVAGGAMTVTFIPIFTEFKETASEREAWQFFSAIASIMSLVILVVLTGTYFLIEPIVHRIGFHDQRFDQTVAMTRIMLPSQAFFYMGGMLIGVLNAHKRFGASSLTGSVYNVVALALGVLLWRLWGGNALGFAWGIVIGAFCGNFLLPLIATLQGPREERLQFHFTLDWKHPGVSKFFRNALPIMLGVSFPVVDQIVMPFFTSHLSPGTLTQLNNGNRVMVAPLAMLAQAASVAAFPYLSGDSATQKWGSFSDFLRSGLRRLMFIALPASTLLILLAQPIIFLVFRHGHFTAEDAHHAAVAFAFYCVGMFAWAGQQFVARGLYALQDTITPTIIGSVLTIFFFIPLCALAARTSQPILGLALATSIGACAHFCGVFIALERKLAQPPYNVELRTERVLGTMLRTIAACLIMGVVGLIVKNLADALLPSTMLWQFLRIVIISIPALAAFGVAAQRFRIPEWQWLLSKVMRRRARTA